MKIIGFNLAETNYGLPLDNGGACLFIDGKIRMMISEERLNRKQYSPGFQLSIQYLLDNNNLQLKDVDLFVASSCLEPQVAPIHAQSQLLKYGFKVPLKKIKICDHHLSHAYSAYYPSGFDNAIVMVLDGDGNVLSENMQPGTNNAKKYWHNELEHNSYYVATKDTIKLVERDKMGAGENGFGGAYRYFTYFCGFPGYKFAGKLMGLSAYGSARNTHKKIKLFEQSTNGQVRCLLPDNNRLNSPKTVENWLGKHNIKCFAREPQNPITAEIEDVAHLVQRELDRALIEKVNYLVKKTGLTNLCIAGGVGLNAVTNRAILDNTPIEKIFIQPAAGDSGQALGNAYFGMHKCDKKNVRRASISVYQGKEYTNREILAILKKYNKNINFAHLKFDELIDIAANKLTENQIIAWFQGRSEIGPRALGNRSILANATNYMMKDWLNSQVKHREQFRPFAPSVLYERAPQWFDITFEAPYMIINAQVTKPAKIPAVTHIDGSARVQTVRKSANVKYYQLITAFEKLTGVPVVINTSFNENESIVETPTDALNCFLRTKIDYLFIGNYMVSKKKI